MELSQDVTSLKSFSSIWEISGKMVVVPRRMRMFPKEASQWLDAPGSTLRQWAQVVSRCGHSSKTCVAKNWVEGEQASVFRLPIASICVVA